MSQNGTIGKNNKLPWHISEDLKRFKALTTGHAAVMGRKTFESLGKPLPNRRNVVLTRDPLFSAAGVETVHSVKEMQKLCTLDEEIFIIGGAEVYKQFLPLADKIYLTLIKKDVEGDAFFAPKDWEKDFQEIERSEEKENPSDHVIYQFVVLKRINKN
jgi:dihydrofolate reductase